MAEWRNGCIRYSGNAINTGNPFKVETLWQGIHQLQITQCTFRNCQGDCVFNNVTNAHIIITGYEGISIIGVFLKNRGSNIGNNQCFNGGRCFIIVKPTNAINAGTLTTDRTIDAGPLGNHIIIQILIRQHAIENLYIVFDSYGVTYHNIDVGITNIPLKRLCRVYAITGNIGSTNGVISADTASCGNSWITCIDQTQIQGIDELDIKNI